MVLDQLSKPYRIALGALLVLAVAWFAVLKPGGGEEPVADATAAATVAQAPGVPGLTRAVTKAKGAAQAAGAANDATAAEAARASGDPASTTPAGSTTTTTPARSARSKRAAKAAAVAEGSGPVAPILASLERGDVAVLSFLQSGGADDAQVRKALRGLSGPVRTFTADIADVGDYAAITQGVPVAQAPATLIIGADRTARVIDGLTTRGELQQVVDDQAER